MKLTENPYNYFVIRDETKDTKIIGLVQGTPDFIQFYDSLDACVYEYFCCFGSHCLGEWNQINENGGVRVQFTAGLIGDELNYSKVEVSLSIEKTRLFRERDRQ